MDAVVQKQLATGVAFLIAAIFIVRRNARPQVVRIWALILIPIVMLAVGALFVIAAPPVSARGIAIVLAGAVLGAGLGYLRAFHSNVSLGIKPGTLLVEGNGVIIALLLGAYALRTIIRAVIGEGSGLGLAISDAVLAFGVASVCVARGMLFFIWRRLVAVNARSVTSDVA